MEKYKKGKFVAKERKSKTLTYKHATFTQSGPDLRKLLSQALLVAAKAWGRAGYQPAVQKLLVTEKYKPEGKMNG